MVTTDRTEKKTNNFWLKGWKKKVNETCQDHEEVGPNIADLAEMIPTMAQHVTSSYKKVKQTKTPVYLNHLFYYL